MSSDNVVAINRIYEAFENRDILTFFGLLSPEIHITQCPQVPWGGVYQGLEETRLFFGKVSAYLEDHVAIEQILDGGDRIAVIGRGQGTILSTGCSFDVPIMHLWAFKDRLAVRLEIVLMFQRCWLRSRITHWPWGSQLFNKEADSFRSTGRSIERTRSR